MSAQTWAQAASAVAVFLTFVATARAETLVLDGEHGYGEVIAKDLEAGSLIDARAARFRVANSKNTDPSADSDCKNGPLPTNRYPLRVYRSPSAVLIGAMFDGEVPLLSDWQYSYCNSAAVSIFDSSNVTIEGVRIRRAWDAVRFSGNSPLFVLQTSWFSDIRDDCLEDDFLKGGLIKDVLFDGCFSGISLREPTGRATDGEPTSRATVGSGQLLTLAGALIRVKPYLYKGEMKTGGPIKASETSPQLHVHDSVFVMDGGDILSRSQLEAGWDRISDCRNNMFLWTSDTPWPNDLAKPPSCFRFVQGEQARFLWEAVRKNWINCHALIGRFSDDTVADALACDRLFYGGQY